MSPDSNRFSRWADELIRLDFNFYNFYSIEKDFHRPHLFFFSVPVLLIAICKLIFFNEWQFAFLVLNLIFLFFSLLYFVKSLLLIGIRPILISLAFPLIIISVDILTWPRYILSDMNYAFLVILAVYFMIKVSIRNEINYVEFFSIIFLLLATRPSSLPVIFVIILFVIVSRFQIFAKQKNLLVFISIILFSITFLLFLAYFILELNFNHYGKVKFITDMVKLGMIVHDRPETWIDVPTNYIDVLHIYFLRLINFFNPYASTFSVFHIFLNIIQIVLILLSVLIWSIFGGDTKIKDHTFFFILLLSFFIAAFHSFILIDYDWRYRFPIILPLIMLIPISLEITLKKLKII
ncbi:hypothetical protein OA868_01030 [Candidatus Pelagibacter sp.]|nr:hypothetical protein [Candidatus Pelagibacter sp.]